MSEYLVDEATGCWVWQRATTRGYGVVWVDGRLWKAHRWYFTVAKGAIPDGLHIDHICNHRLCVNPAHLEAVTQAENNRRMGERMTHCKRGHKFTPETTRTPSEYIGNGRRRCAICAREAARRRYHERKAAA